MTWRPMLASDIPAVFDLSRRIHPDYPESEAVLAERQALAPSWCHVFGDKDGLAGYFLAHPWRLGAPPALDTHLGTLFPDPDTLYVHDLALLPRIRGTGVAGVIVRHTIAQAHGFPAVSLVAVNGTVPFWTRFGFIAEQVHARFAKTLASYGPETRFMVRRKAREG